MPQKNDFNNPPAKMVFVCKDTEKKNKELSSKQTEFLNKADGLFHCIINANANLCIYKKLKDLLEKEPEKFEPVMKESPVFGITLFRTYKLLYFLSSRSYMMKATGIMDSINS